MPTRRGLFRRSFRATDDCRRGGWFTIGLSGSYPLSEHIVYPTLATQDAMGSLRSNLRRCSPFRIMRSSASFAFTPYFGGAAPFPFPFPFPFPHICLPSAPMAKLPTNPAWLARRMCSSTPLAFRWGRTMSRCGRFLSILGAHQRASRSAFTPGTFPTSWRMRALHW